jgi:pimeloyl-ACP methyl ester carboxylesterase
VSTLRSLQLPEQVRSATLMTARGPFAILEAKPARGVSFRKPALLVPGYTGSKENFLPILEPLAAAGRTVVAFDQRGQYQSPDAPDRAGYAPAALAADLLAIADVVGRASEGVHLVGHSMGGLIAREAVLRRPTGFESFTLLGSGPGTISGPRAEELRQALAVLDPAGGAQPDDKGQLAAIVRQIWHDQHEPEARAEGVDEHVIAFLKERMLRTCPLHLIALARYLLDCPDLSYRLAAVVASGLPVQVVYGENDDAWSPAEQDDMAERLGAERTCIPGAAHSPAIEAPVTTASTLTNFWNAAERRRRPTPESRVPAKERAQSTRAQSSTVGEGVTRLAASASASSPSAGASRPSHGRRAGQAARPSGQ